MFATDRSKLEVDAVAAGFHVQYSASRNTFLHGQYKLNSNSCWDAASKAQGIWIQVTS